MLIMINSMSLEIIIWDVNHGNSTSIRLPNGKTMILDCAANPLTEFSPILHTKKRWGYLDLLMISHPHLDHISDIFNIDYLKPRLLIHPEISHHQLREGKDGDALEVIEKYIDFTSGYKPIPISQQDHNKSWGDEVEILYFGLNGHQDDINDYSLVTFLSYSGFTFCYAGDLTTKGWEALINQEGYHFTNMLRKTNFFEVSHHGRQEGFNPLIFDYMKDLKLAFVSDKHYQTTSITSTYSQYCEGWQVVNENTNEIMDGRKVLTTRSDGRIKITANTNGNDTEVGVTTLDHSF
jgi:beta-lactamase superfamily II metal-dependent hydrolase